MKILFSDMKEGVMELLLQSLTDLWHLSHVITPGDIIRARTTRRVAIKRGSEVDYGERVPVTVTIQLEKTEFHKNTGRLRLAGMILEGPEDISKGHHSIIAEPGMRLRIKKEWKKAEVERIKRARFEQPRVLICLIDRDRANFISLRESGIDILGEKETRRVPKGFELKGIRKEDAEGPFYKEVSEYLSGEKEYERIVLAGPGFEKENILKYIKAHYTQLAPRIITESTSSTTKSGVNEILKRSADRILLQTRIARETKLVESFLGLIKNEGLAAYGKLEVEKAVDMGAVGRLLVSEEKINDFESLMEKVEKAGGDVEVIAKNHEAGEQFLSIGGIGAFLRFRTGQ